MNVFETAFKKAKSKGKPAFMPFLVAGDPDYKTSLSLFHTLAPHADMLEIGFPYSDPLADGPTIQAADERALHSGMDTGKVFALIKEIRTFYKSPISVLVYANLVYQYGVDAFYKEAAAVGINGVLIPDVPYEEAIPFVLAAKKHKISPIFIVAKTSTEERLKNILQYAEGYLYLVSVLGVTGSRNTLGKDTFDFIRRVKKNTSLPLALGFGISKKEHVQETAKAGIDGVIIGSAIIKLLEANLTNAPKASKAIEAFIKDIITE